MPKQREIVTEDSASGPRIPSLGRYRIVAELARGGMGIVYLALVRGPGAFNKLLVLKELKPALLNDAHLVAMFLEEARLAACLHHPNVVQTIEAGSDGGRHYIAMEHLNGQSLHRLIRRAQREGAKVPLALHGSVLCAALEGLAYAHNAADYDGQPLHIVHRDVSPHNILVSYEGQTKVLDFGIAKAMNSGIETLAGVIKGKVAYMAPEQAGGSNVDARADIFSVGVILWEAVTSRRFWSRLDGDGKILRALMVGESPLEDSSAMEGVPLDLRPIIARATAFDPEERYPSAATLLSELRAALDRLGVRPFSGPEVGKYIQSLFAEDRAALQAAIEETLNFYRGPSSGQFAAVEVPSFSPDLSEVPSMNMVASERTPAAGLAIQATIRSATPVLSKTNSKANTLPVAERSRSKLVSRAAWTLGAVALGVALTEVAITFRTREPAAAVPLTAAPPVVTAKSGEGALAETARVTVRASPPTARIAIDGKLVSENPWVAQLPRNDEPHTVRVEADGYVAHDESFEAASDTTLIITLEPRRGQPRAAGFVRTAPPAAAAQGAALVSPPAPPSIRTEPSPPAPAPGSVPLRRINPLNPYAQ